MAKTKIQFLIHPDEPEVFAYFPDLDFDLQGNKTCYAHIGQHGACNPAYAQECRGATKEEYKALKTELTDLVGYEDLKVIKS